MEENQAGVTIPVAEIDDMIVRRAKLYAALAKAQGAFPEIAKNRDVEITMKSGGKFRFRYADLQQIISQTKKPLSDNGLSVIQTLNTDDSGRVILCTVLAHADGATLRSQVTLPASVDTDPKASGAVITYFRRYTLCALINVAADDDLDENRQEMSVDPAEMAVILEMGAEADKGVAAYQTYWSTSLNTAQRKERKHLHDAMKARAIAADASKAEANASAAAMSAQPDPLGPPLSNPAEMNP